MTTSVGVAIAASAVIASAALTSSVSVAVAASPERFPTTGPHKSCPFVRVPEIYPGYPANGIGAQEIALFGGGWPSYGSADRLLRSAPTKVSEHRWRRFDGWRCVWEVGWEECKRARACVYVSNPGD